MHSKEFTKCCEYYNKKIIQYRIYFYADFTTNMSW